MVDIQHPVYAVMVSVLCETRSGPNAAAVVVMIPRRNDTQLPGFVMAVAEELQNFAAGHKPHRWRGRCLVGDAVEKLMLRSAGDHVEGMRLPCSSWGMSNSVALSTF